MCDRILSQIMEYDVNGCSCKHHIHPRILCRHLLEHFGCEKNQHDEFSSLVHIKCFFKYLESVSGLYIMKTHPSNANKDRENFHCTMIIFKLDSLVILRPIYFKFGMFSKTYNGDSAVVYNIDDFCKNIIKILSSLFVINQENESTIIPYIEFNLDSRCILNEFV